MDARESNISTVYYDCRRRYCGVDSRYARRGKSDDNLAANLVKLKQAMAVIQTLTGAATAFGAVVTVALAVAAVLYSPNETTPLKMRRK